jgi:hypothetical protein
LTAAPSARVSFWSMTDWRGGGRNREADVWRRSSSIFLEAANFVVNARRSCLDADTRTLEPCEATDSLDVVLHQLAATTPVVQFGEPTMKFTVISGAGITEIIDRPASARTALELVLTLLGRKRKDVLIFDEDGWRRTPADLCRLAAKEVAKEVAMLPDQSGLSF